MTIRVLIVDDERPARDELAYLLSAHPDVESAEAASAAEALRKLADERFDLVLQDIQMPGHDGFHVLREAQAQPGEAAPLFVFVTAFDQHAIRAFEENALDYLLKPVAPSRLARCLDRVRGR
ncbi:MAG TPA: DNA-binding response regulator, partial [Desulfovibrio sp.]|nr:DNA-binding response regulator [Desulfovibrio sp.]